MDKKILEDLLGIFQLAKSINSPDNLINPIIVYPDKFNFIIVAGHHRFLAHKLLKKDEIKSTILDKKPDDLSINLIRWKENEDRLDLSLYEKIINVSNIINYWEHANKSIIKSDGLGTLLSVGKSTSKKYLRVTKEISCNKKYEEAIRNNFISSLLVAYSIANIKNNTEKTNAVDKILDGKKFTPNDIKQGKHFGKKSPKVRQIINLKSVDNLDAITQITMTLIKSSLLKNHYKQLSKMPLKTKADLSHIWKIIYQKLTNE